jgi:hypothetical protein
MKTFQLGELIKELERLRDEKKVPESNDVIFDSDDGWSYIHKVELDGFNRVRLS